MSLVIVLGVIHQITILVIAAHDYLLSYDISITVSSKNVEVKSIKKNCRN